MLGDMPKIAAIRVFSHRNSLKHLNFKRFRRFPADVEPEQALPRKLRPL
jgi:hypothetical protein